MTFSFSPIRDESGNVGGIFHPISESTEKMLSSRRTQVIRDLAIQISKAQSLSEMYESVRISHSMFDLDLPFLIFFEVNAITGQPELKSYSGLEDNSSLLTESTWGLQSFRDVSQVNDLAAKFGAFKSGPYEKPPQTAMIIPVYSPGGDQPILYAVAGVSSAREIDTDYRSFYDLLRNTLTTAVTNIRAYEEEQKRAQALAQIDKAKTAFFSNVSHEFRTPLTLMIGPLEDSLADTEEPLTPKQHKRQELIHRNSLRLLKLVNSLLDFSRIEAGRIQAHFQPVNLSAYTSELASVFRSTIESAGLKFKISCEKMPEEIYVDRDMWEKIILNLLSNAFKFTFEGSVQVSCAWKNDGAVIKVSDTGIGVSQEEVPRLFERFHRVHGAKSRTYEGTGIGLALVYELVKMHGGEISVQSELGKGTTFEIFMPKGRGHLPQEKILDGKKLESTSIASSAYIQASMWGGTESGSVASKTETSKTILLADDNTDMRNYVASILGEKWNVLTAQDGEEAYSIAARVVPDLVLTDVMMPVLDGFGLLKKIRDDHNLRSIPTVLLSARAGEEAKVEGLKAGADDYLVKPFSAKELITRIDAILSMNSLRFEATKELALNAEKFRSTFAHASVNIAMLSLDGTILEINNAFLTKTGYNSEEVIGKNFAVVTYPEDVESNKQTLEKLSRGEEISATFEKRYIKKDGSSFWVKTSVSSALGPDNEPLYLIAVSQDIDAIKTSEHKYMEAVRELEEEKDLREKFVATLTHDLRSPMTSAKVSAQLIQRKPESLDSVQSQAARIVNNVNRADKMIQDLLDANRIQAGEKIPLTIEAIDIDVIVHDTLDNFITLYGDRFSYKHDQKKITGYWSLSGIARILDNLINNAIKYGETNGIIEVERISSDKFMELSVHNFGNPLSKDDQDHIFDPYKRSKTAETGKQKGWGLGLTLVRGVTEAMGGTVSVESSATSGTTFKVVLPLDSREAYAKYE